MRWLLKFVIVLCALWCGYWWVAATALERGIAGAVARDQRLQIGRVEVSGFPFAFVADAQGVWFEDRQAETQVTTGALRLRAPAYWPGDVQLFLAETPVSTVFSGVPLVFGIENGVARVQTRPGRALALEQVSLTSGAWHIAGPGLVLVSASDLQASLRDSGAAGTYDFSLSADGLSPGEVVREGLALSPDWPETFDPVLAEGRVGFDHPIDRFALVEGGLQPRLFQLAQLSVRWGDVQIAGHGELTFDAAGLPEGSLMFNVRNWRQLVDMAATSGILPASGRGQAEVLLTALANRSGDGDDIDLEVLFAQGQMFLSGIPLGPAPRLFQR